MAPRRRHQRNLQLPRNLRVRDGYYSYTSPITGMEKGLGRDKRAAIEFALVANEKVDRVRCAVSPADWVVGDVAPKTWGAWLDRYALLLKEKDLSYQTRAVYESVMRRARKQWDGSLAITAITTAMVADAIRSVIDEGHRRMAQMYRSWLRECFRCANAEGWRTDNPVSVTNSVKVKTLRARLGIEHYRAIYDDAQTPAWLRNAMALALVSGQRREEVAKAQRRDIREGYWWVEQKKTGSRVAIPLSIRLEVIGMSLADVLEQCRATGVLSPHVIHQPQRDGNYKAGRHVHRELITREFTLAVARLGIDWEGKTPPTFHELRSLSKRLYDAQGGVNTKQLLGHRSDSAANTYSDARGQWVKVSLK